MNAQNRSSRAAKPLNLPEVIFNEREYLPRCICCLLSGLFHPCEKEFKPSLPVSVRANTVKQFVIFLPVHFEIKAEVKNGLTDSTGDAQQERNQQTPQSPVSVQEGVNGFELHMHEGRLHEK